MLGRARESDAKTFSRAHPLLDGHGSVTVVGSEPRLIRN
jgi:hypothetical protein